MNFLYKLERKYGRYAVKNLSLILIICYAAGYVLQFVNPTFMYFLTLDPYAIVHGQVWRIVSWLLIPPNESNMFFALIMMFFYYSIGTTLERTWGSFLYDLYLFSGMFFTVLGSFLLMGYVYVFQKQLIETIDPGYVFRVLSLFYSTYYVNMSIFLAFATTFPEERVLLMFIIPIKVKWLGFIYGGFILYDMISGMVSINMINGALSISFIYPFVIGSSLLNFIVFFISTRRYLKKRNSFMKSNMRAYKKKMKSVKKDPTKPVHRCAVCGRTELDGDDLVFRYCSKCEGNYEFCQDHLYSHVHIISKKD